MGALLEGVLTMRGAAEYRARKPADREWPDKPAICAPDVTLKRPAIHSPKKGCALSTALTLALGTR